MDVADILQHCATETGGEDDFIISLCVHCVYVCVLTCVYMQAGSVVSKGELKHLFIQCAHAIKLYLRG